MPRSSPRPHTPSLAVELDTFVVYRARRPLRRWGVKRGDRLVIWQLHDSLPDQQDRRVTVYVLPRGARRVQVTAAQLHRLETAGDQTEAAIAQACRANARARDRKLGVR